MDTLIALEPGLGGTPKQDTEVNPEESSQIPRSYPYHSKPSLLADKSQTAGWSVPAAFSNQKTNQEKPMKIPVNLFFIFCPFSKVHIFYSSFF